MDYLKIIFRNSLKISPISEVKLSLMFNRSKNKSEILFNNFVYNDFFPFKIIIMKDKVSTEYYNSKMKLHRIDGPAYITINGTIKIEKYFENSIVNRIDGPAEIIHFGDKLYKETWYIRDLQHRIEKDKPTCIIYSNNKIVQEEYRLLDLCHRENGPAIIMYDENGKIIQEEYYIHGKFHREYGPALIDYENNYEEYYYNGELLENL